MAETIEIGGAALECVWHGPAADEAPTILLLHEGLGCVAMWRDFPERLSSETGCGVLAYSRQGYGASDAVALPRPLSYMSDEAFNVLPLLIEHWNLRHIVLAGHSDGASIAAVYAGGVSDGRVLGTILISPHFFNEDLCVRTISDARESYEHGDLKSKLERYHGANADCAFYGWNGAWLDPDFMQWNIEEYLPATKSPVLLVWGADDPYGTIAQVHGAEAGYGERLTVAMMQNSSHWPFREESDATMTHIVAFVRGLLQGAQRGAAP